MQFMMDKKKNITTWSRKQIKWKWISSKNTKLELAIPKVNGENPEKVLVNSIQEV